MTPSDLDQTPGLGAVASAISAEAAALTLWLSETRRDIHAHAEVSRAEHRTTELIVAHLRSLGLVPKHLGVPTGCIVDIVPEGWSGELIALRADIDALPLEDAKDVPYRSQNAGATHACGHDVHTTILMGAATVLVRLRERGLLERGVRLFFQPAEEVSPGGAHDVIAAGGLEGVAEAYALHCDPATAVGQVAVRTGAITSACDQFRITVRGPGGHTSRPHLSADVVGALGTIITQLPLIMSRRVDPRGGASLVWGHVEAGNAPNAIPATGVLEGTLRCLDVEAWRTGRELVVEAVADLCAPFGVTAEVTRAEGIAPTVNAPGPTRRMAGAIAWILGPQAVAETGQSLGGEDFSEYLLRVPGSMARLGVRGDVAAGDLHRPEFDVDERCLGVGVRVMAALATLPD